MGLWVFKKVYIDVSQFVQKYMVEFLRCAGPFSDVGINLRTHVWIYRRVDNWVDWIPCQGSICDWHCVKSVGKSTNHPYINLLSQMVCYGPSE